MQAADKSLEDAFVEAKAELATAEATVAEASALEEAQTKLEIQAQKEFDAAGAAVEAAVAAETEALEKWREAKLKKDVVVAKTIGIKDEMLRAQKKLITVEHAALHMARVKEWEEKRKAATEALEEATKKLLEQRQKEEALEQTKKALEEARQKTKAAKAAPKRGVVGEQSPAKKAYTDDQETVPATLVDGWIWPLR